MAGCDARRRHGYDRNGLELKRYKGSNLLPGVAGFNRVVGKGDGGCAIRQGFDEYFAADVIFGRLKDVGDFRSDIL
jgi:hypothetical protein